MKLRKLKGKVYSFECRWSLCIVIVLRCAISASLDFAGACCIKGLD